MKTLVQEPCRFEFLFPQLKASVSVENMTDEIVVRTSSGTLSEERKTAFVRELASEGFIPDRYQRFSPGSEGLFGRVRWLVGPVWWMGSPELKTNTFRFVARELSAPLSCLGSS